MKKVLEILESHVGYLEKASNKDLDSKTKNAGRANYTCFARDYKEYTGANFQAQAWCAMFVSVCFAVAYGLEKAKELLCGNLYAYCPYGMAAFAKKGQLHTKPKKGDIIFFLKNGLAYHTGVVYKVSGNHVYTIEGNTSGGSSVIPNGGGVCKKSYVVNSNMRFGRPDYSLVTGETATSKLTKAKLISKLQKAIDVQIDGLFGKQTLAALPTLKNGSKGTCVKLLQRGLQELHEIQVDGGADGVFGAGTEKALKKFQKKNGLQVDGICGEMTWNAFLD